MMIQSRTVGLAAGLVLIASGACAGEFEPIATYTADPAAVVGPGSQDGSTYVHTATAGFTYKPAGALSFTVQGAWAAGQSLSEQSIGDVAGVQGAFAGENEVMLYELAANLDYGRARLRIGRLSAGDAFGTIGAMDQFVNSAFSSNGGAISVNDPGRGPSPASTWGMHGEVKATSALTLRAGAFLSDPALLDPETNGVDFTFNPDDGVLGFAEAEVALAADWSAGIGGYADSADVSTFDGAMADGNHGGYAWVTGPLRAAPVRGVDGFLMVQSAPQRDRNLLPLFLAAGATLNAPWASRPDDVLGFAVQSGQFSRRSGLEGWETTYELTYLFTVNRFWGVQPDVQYVVNPGGANPDALVLGLQIAFALPS